MDKPNKFLRLQDVANKVAMGKSTILFWEAEGRFPKAIRLSATLRVWSEISIEQWMKKLELEALGVDDE